MDLKGGGIGGLGVLLKFQLFIAITVETSFAHLSQK